MTLNELQRRVQDRKVKNMRSHKPIGEKKGRITRRKFFPRSPPRPPPPLEKQQMINEINRLTLLYGNYRRSLIESLLKAESEAFKQKNDREMDQYAKYKTLWIILRTLDNSSHPNPYGHKLFYEAKKNPLIKDNLEYNTRRHIRADGRTKPYHKLFYSIKKNPFENRILENQTRNLIRADPHTRKRLSTEGPLSVQQIERFKKSLKDIKNNELQSIKDQIAEIETMISPKVKELLRKKEEERKKPSLV